MSDKPPPKPRRKRPPRDAPAAAPDDAVLAAANPEWMNPLDKAALDQHAANPEATKAVWAAYLAAMQGQGKLRSQLNEAELSQLLYGTPTRPESVEYLVAEIDRLRAELAGRTTAPTPTGAAPRTAPGPMQPGELAKIVAANLPIFRAAAHGMSQRELADRASISKNHLSLIEAAKANITLETLERLALALDRSPLDLLVRKVV